MSPNIQITIDDLSRKDRFNAGERSEFHLLLIDGIVKIVLDDYSRKDRYLVRKENGILLNPNRQ